MQTSTDHPNVIIFPPFIALGTIAWGFLMQWLLPLHLLARVALPVRGSAGFLLLDFGVFLMIVGQRTLSSLGTNTNPRWPTTALAIDGVYEWTRNPMYAGGRLAMLGIALMFGTDWLLLLIAPSAALLHYGVVLREERYLERKFGDAYMLYKALAPRYIWNSIV